MDPEARAEQPEAGGLKVGDKTYTAGDVESMLAQQAEATKVMQSHSKVQQLAQRYGLSPDEFLTNAEGSFSAVSNLIENKVIDEYGNLLVGKKEESEDDLLSSFFGGEEQRERRPAETAASPRGNDNGQTKALLKVLSEVKGTTGQLGKEIERLRKDNETLVRYNISSQLSKAFPDLAPDEIDTVIERARADRSTGLSDHAKRLVERKTGIERLAQQKLARELGIEDLDAHLNQLKQQKEGGAGALFKGKKISFKPKGDDAVSPSQAAEAYFGAQLRQLG